MKRTSATTPLACLLTVVFSVAAAMGAPADDKSKQSAQESLEVAAHVNVSGPPATEMRIQHENNRIYLYLIQGSGNGFTVMDVTKPEKPKVLKEMTLPPGTSARNLNIAGNSMGIVEESNSGGNDATEHPRSVQLFDLSDPANPRALQSFNNVSSVLSEDGRRLVYVVNDQGLWILKRPVRPTTRPACTSSSATSPVPQCH